MASGPVYNKFVLKALPKPEYMVLRDLCRVMDCDQHEAICTILDVLARDWSEEFRQKFYSALRQFRKTPPSEANLPPIKDYSI